MKNIHIEGDTKTLVIDGIIGAGWEKHVEEDIINDYPDESFKDGIIEALTDIAVDKHNMQSDDPDIEKIRGLLRDYFENIKSKHNEKI